MDNGMLNLMYKDAYMNLSNGIVNPLDKDILSYAPLPDSVIDPYITQDVDPLATMNLTNNTLKVWIEESKKANYFTTHFVTLSRMIMNGVATMARGLVTLHMKGEDLEQAPLSIRDLISISSYQFRKSYIGVLQTVKSKPEVSERLLMNQLRWNNTLIKLFKTREKLARPKPESSDFEVQSSNIGNDEKGLPEAEIKPVLGSQVSGLESDVSSLSELPALDALCAYGAIRPYSALTAKGSWKAVSGNRKSAAETLISGTDKSLETGSPAIQSEPESGKELKNGNTEIRKLQQDSSSQTSQPEQQIKDGVKNTGSEQNEKKYLKSFSSETKNISVPDQEKEKNGTENPGESNQNNETATDEKEPSKVDDSVTGTAEKTEGNSSFFPHNSSLPDRPPEYARILYRALCRSSGNEDGALEFTLDEIYDLLADPGFCRYEPQLAADLRKALQASGT